MNGWPVKVGRFFYCCCATATYGTGDKVNRKGKWRG